MLHSWRSSLGALSVAGWLAAGAGDAAAGATLGRPDRAWQPLTHIIPVQNAGPQDAQIQDKLSGRGYRNIRIETGSSPFLVDACRGEERYELRVSEAGDILKARVSGECRSGPATRRRFAGTGDPSDLLRRDGYTNIDVLGKRGLRTTYAACLGGRRERVVVESNGRIISREEIGPCFGTRPADRTDDPRRRDRQLDRSNRAFHPGIASFLGRRGYYDMAFVAEDGPYVLIEACRNVRRFRLAIDPTGRHASKRRRIGWCDPEGAYRSH